MVSRRRFLGAAAAGLCGVLAGCVDPAGVLRMSDATADEIVENATNVVKPTYADRSDLLDDALENGSATVEATRPPLNVDRPIAYREQVYAVSVIERGERTRTDHTIALDFDPGETNGTEIPLDDLPAVDAERIEPLLEHDPPAGNDGYDIGTRTHYTDEEREASVLVPDREVDVILVDGDPVRVRTEPAETTLTTFEYAIDDRLGSAAAYADGLREEYRFALAGLSDDERAIVEEAIDEGGYYAPSTDDEAFEDVARAFLDAEPVISDDYWGGWLVDYDGATYWAHLRLTQYGDLREELPSTG